MKEENKTRSKSRKKKKRKLPIFIFFILVIAIVVCAIIYIPKIKEQSKQAKLKKQLLGSWTTDGYTVYEFYEEGEGALKIPMADYVFSYTIDENKVSIDFENEKSIDSDYEFSFEGKTYDILLAIDSENNDGGLYQEHPVEENNTPDAITPADIVIDIKKIVQTGDGTPIAVVAVIFLLSIIGITLRIRKKKKNNKDKKDN